MKNGKDRTTMNDTLAPTPNASLPGVQFDDLYTLGIISDAQISPDGTQVAYVVTSLDKEHNEYRSAIWLITTDGRTPGCQYTAGTKQDMHPRWSPDGQHIAFVSSRTDKPQIFIIALTGGEARQLTKQAQGAGTPVWTPDGSTIIFSGQTSAEDSLDTPPATDKPPKLAKTRIITHANYREDGRGYRDGKWMHLFSVQIASGNTTQLTDGEWDDTQPAVSPDGQTIAFVSARFDGRELSTHSDIWLIDADGANPRGLTDHTGPWQSPAWSPDGRQIAYVGFHDPEDVNWMTHTHVWIHRADGTGTPRDVMKSTDLEVGDAVLSDVRGPLETPPVQWSADGSAVIALISRQGETHIACITIDMSDIEWLSQGHLTVLSVAQATHGARLSYVATDLLSPPDVYTCLASGAEEQRLTTVNDALLSTREISPPAMVWFASADGQQVQGWLMRPLGWMEGHQYPLLLSVHGGPHAAYGASFFHELQTYAAHGYGVFFCNPRGSASYGQTFKSCIEGDWGNLDYQDITAAADYCAALPWVDANRLAIAGGSYGGYMTLWTIGHTHRFKAAVSGRCVSNLLSFMGTSDGGWLWEKEFKARPGTDSASLLRQSPITYIDNMRTPLLLEAQEADHRCLIEQSEQVFMGLRARGQVATLVRFPDESHGMSRNGKPSRRIERLELTMEWFDRHLQSDKNGRISS